MALGANALAITANNMVRVGANTVTSIGGQVGWTTMSDARTKINVKENVAGLNFILGLRPVTYHYDRKKENELLGMKDDSLDYEWKHEMEKIQFSGFLAQEVEAAAKQIGYNFSGVDKTGDVYGLRYSDFVVPIVKAMQEQQAIIEKQQTTIESKNKELTELKAKFEQQQAKYEQQEARMQRIEKYLELKVSK